MIIRIIDAATCVGKSVTLHGWIYNKRSSGKIAFLEIRDGSGMLQGVLMKNAENEALFANAEKVGLESSVELTGTLTAHPKQKGVFELQIEDMKVVQNVTAEYPIGKKEHGPDFLMEHRHLWLRAPKQWAIQRIRNTVIYATYEFMRAEGFLKMDSPILTPNACEGTTTLFELEYFDQGKAYLSQSGQLYLEAAIFSFGRCFDFGPVFRAEKSKTRRHLTEFWMMDAEAAFVEQVENMQIQERLICLIVEKVLRDNQQELKILERDLAPLQKIKAPFIHKTHTEVVAELRSMGSQIGEKDDLGAEDETLLTEKYDQPIFVEKYPAEVKAFYMKRDPANPAFALCADLLAPEGYGEIIGGSQREDDYEVLLKRIKEHKLPQKEFQWYLDLRKYGSVPHSGFGYGLERITAWLCGIKHVRETIPFPRTIYRIYP